MSTELENTYSPVPALHAYAKYGVPKSTAIFLQHNFWEVPTKHMYIFGTYFILSWNASYLRGVIEDGMIERYGKFYQVIYHRTNPAEIKKAKGAVMLSFRELETEYEVQPVVLVSVARKGGE